MHRDAQGRRVVLYACHSEHKGRETALSFGEAEGASVYHGPTGPLSYALAG